MRGVVRVASFQTATRALVMPALARLAAAHPALRVELTELEAEESLPLLARGGVDIAIAEEYEHAPRPRLPELHRDDLEADELVLTLPRAHAAAAAAARCALASLRGEAWATARAGTNYADMFVRACRIAGGFEPDIHHRVNDIADAARPRRDQRRGGAAAVARAARPRIRAWRSCRWSRGRSRARCSWPRGRPIARGRRRPRSSTRSGLPSA